MSTLELKASIIDAIQHIDENDVPLIEKIDRASRRILKAATHEPTITEADLEVTHFVANLSKSTKMPEDFDYEQAEFDYLQEKYK